MKHLLVLIRFEVQGGKLTYIESGYDPISIVFFKQSQAFYHLSPVFLRDGHTPFAVTWIKSISGKE